MLGLQQQQHGDQQPQRGGAQVEGHLAALLLFAQQQHQPRRQQWQHDGNQDEVRHPVRGHKKRMAFMAGALRGWLARKERAAACLALPRWGGARKGVVVRVLVGVMPVARIFGVCAVHMVGARQAARGQQDHQEKGRHGESR